MVFSLVTDVELLENKAGDLGQDIQDKGTRWVQMPVRFGEAPNAPAAAIWSTISVQARKALFGGGRVMIHSGAGRGRSGMLALRLMIEAGEAPDEAQARLQGVQRGAFLNEAQMAWALAAERDPVTFVRHPRSA
jgi:protein-tyrosine phosphatase